MVEKAKDIKELSDKA